MLYNFEGGCLLVLWATSFYSILFYLIQFKHIKKNAKNDEIFKISENVIS